MIFIIQIQTQMHKDELDVPTMDSFDETSLQVDFLATGLQNSLIRVDSHWVGAQKNVAAMDCRWFSKTQHSIQPMEGVSGTTYQPSLADVNTIIYVQCMPSVEGLVYEGMPITKQVGPLHLDEATQHKAWTAFQDKNAQFSVKVLDSCSPDSGSKGCISLQNEQLRVQAAHDRHRSMVSNISPQFPRMDVSRSNSKRLTLRLDQAQSVRLQFSDHEVRDVFMLLLTLIQGSQEVACNGIQSPNESLRHLYHIRTLCTFFQQTHNNASSMAVELDSRKKQLEQMQKVKAETDERLVNLNLNYFQMENTLIQLQSITQQQRQQLIYYKVQMKLLKQQNHQVSLQLSQSVRELGQLRAEVEQSEGIREQQSHIQRLSIQLSSSQDLVQQYQHKYQHQAFQRERLLQSVKDLTANLEQNEAQRAHLQRKWQSLTQELKATNYYPLNAEGTDHKGAELACLNKQIKLLAMENNTLRGLALHPNKSSNTRLKSELLEVKQLANRLAEAITEKDLLLGQIRLINKDLNSKLKARDAPTSFM